MERGGGVAVGHALRLWLPLVPLCSFVHDELFPFARAHCKAYLEQHWDEDALQSALGMPPSDLPVQRSWLPVIDSIEQHSLLQPLVGLQAQCGSPNPNGSILGHLRLRPGRFVHYRGEELGTGHIWNGKIGHNKSVPTYAMVLKGPKPSL